MRCRRRAHVVDVELFDGTIGAARRCRDLGTERHVTLYIGEDATEVHVTTADLTCQLSPGDRLVKDNYGVLAVVGAEAFLRDFEGLEDGAEEAA